MTYEDADIAPALDDLQRDTGDVLTLDAGAALCLPRTDRAGDRGQGIGVAISYEVAAWDHAQRSAFPGERVEVAARNQHGSAWLQR